MVTLKGYTANVLGLSTDAKPTTGVGTNTIFRELDTGKRYYFNGSAWAEIPQSGGGGSSAVTSVNGKTGAVVLGASDVGAYEIVENAVENNFAAFDDDGDLKDSGKKPSDFATPSDVANEEIEATATGTSITLTDSADGYVQGITAKGHSEKSKNLFNPNDVLDVYIDINSQLVTSGVTVKTVYAKCNPNTTYTVSKTAGERFVVAYSVNEPVVNGYVTKLSDDQPTAAYITVTTGNDAGYIVAWVYNSNYDTIPAEQMLSSVQIEEGSTATPYEPYGIISIGDAGWGVVDLGTLTWIKDGSRFRSDTISNQIKSVRAWNDPSSINSKYETGWVSSSGGDDKRLGIYQAVVYVRDMDYTDATAFKSALSGVLLYYPLADTTGATPTLGITSKDGTSQGTAVTIVSRDYYFDEHLYESTLPLCSLSDTYYDEMNSADEIIIKRCTAVSDVSGFDWRGSNGNFYFVLDSGCSEKVPIMIEGYTYQDVDSTDLGNMCCTLEVYNADSNITRMVYIHNTSCYAVAALTTALANKKAILPWDKAIVIPMTATEKSAFVALRTYDGTTHIDATDNPSMTVDYLLNTDNGQAVARIDERAMKQYATLLAMIAAPYDETATYAQGAYCTYLGTLYKANTAIGTAEPFTAAHWTATTVMEEI